MYQLSSFCKNKNEIFLKQKLTMKLYTDGICLSDCVFSILSSSKFSNPIEGRDNIDVPDKSLLINWIILNDDSISNIRKYKKISGFTIHEY